MQQRLASNPRFHDHDASFPCARLSSPALNLDSTDSVQGYRIKLMKDQSQRAGAHFKVGWAFEGANLHPGVWDNLSWSIGGTGVRCHGGFWDTEGNSCLRYVGNEGRRKLTVTAFESFLRRSKPATRRFFSLSTTTYIAKDRRHVIHMLSITLTLRMGANPAQCAWA